MSVDAATAASPVRCERSSVLTTRSSGRPAGRLAPACPPNPVRATPDASPPASVPRSSRERVFSAVVAHHDRHGYPPTVRELAAATDLAVSTVAYHVDGLVAAGRLVRRPGLVRTLVPAPVVAGAT
ncbi:LexA family protein [Actinoplanes sp. NPDC049668]|uniref:LexA family protein n=1 Tax=unclassified Actinoplanes TaxID=2626549 RepID=UPI0033AA41C5